jgi:hypothetical protein
MKYRSAHTVVRILGAHPQLRGSEVNTARFAALSAKGVAVNTEIRPSRGLLRVRIRCLRCPARAWCRRRGLAHVVVC